MWCYQTQSTLKKEQKETNLILGKRKTHDQNTSNLSDKNQNCATSFSLGKQLCFI
ncbi:hypothetical protein [Spiroplasma poulsonii]|uniref:hypothetical protein n=1 Tax=Spiroplasma poulsonii TaxID=2138 RepID=UPI001F4C6945|nr:hypothetical protein [Spiroplasma poulsonii]UNF62381.1 hypothetical protein MNU24_02640 [Spiroplasma poulsonii]